VRRSLLLPLLLLLAACSTLPPSTGSLPVRDRVTDFGLDARFSVTYAAERHSGRMDWEHATAGDTLRIYSPFGQTVAELRFDAGGATLLAADGTRHEAATAELLMRDVLGYPLPIGDLAGWVLARGRAGADIERDAAGRPLKIAEDGWQVTYEYDDEAPGALPARLSVSRDGGPELRLRIEDWHPL